MRYPGGKGRLFQRIISMMPPHDLYVETHLGGGAVIRNKAPALASIGIDIDPRVIEVARTWRLPGLELYNCAAEDFFANIRLDVRTLIYVDPPYLAATKRNRRYYRFEYSDQEHERLLAKLLRLDCLVMISGYDNDLYSSRLKNWRRTELTNVTHKGRRSEVLWANFSESSVLHDYRSVGAGFRDRERIKRKIDRWVKKFDALPPVERNALVDALLRSTAHNQQIDR